jgi:hypothetical protein
MVWGGISWDGSKEVVEVNWNMNADRYISNSIEEHVAPYVDFIGYERFVSFSCLTQVMGHPVQVAKRSLILGKWMRSEIVGSRGERPTVKEAVGGFSVFLVSRISHSICASQVSSYALRPVCRYIKRY